MDEYVVYSLTRCVATPKKNNILNTVQRSELSIIQHRTDSGHVRYFFTSRARTKKAQRVVCKLLNNISNTHRFILIKLYCT